MDVVAKGPSAKYCETRWFVDDFTNRKEGKSTGDLIVGGFVWNVVFYPNATSREIPHGDPNNMFSFFLCRVSAVNLKKRKLGNVLVLFSVVGVHNDDEKRNHHFTQLNRFEELDKAWASYVKKPDNFHEFLHKDTLTFVVRIQVIEEKKDDLFRCVDNSWYLIYLAKFFLKAAERKIADFVKECKSEIAKVTKNDSEKTRFMDFWGTMDSENKNNLSWGKREKIIEGLLTKFPVDEVCSVVVMESLCAGLMSIEGETKTGLLVQNDERAFGLRESESLLKALESESDTDDISAPEAWFDLHKRLSYLGCRAIEMFVLTYILRNFVSYKNTQELSLHAMKSTKGATGGLLQKPKKRGRKEKKSNQRAGHVQAKEQADDHVREDSEVLPLVEIKLNLMTITNIELGKGRRSIVYKGEFSFVEVAVKEIPCVEANIRKEVIKYGRIGHHPNIVMYHGCEWDEKKKILYVAFELCTCSLHELFSGSKEIGFERNQLWNDETNFLYDLFRGIIEGVSHLHSRNLIHRNLSPENILVTISKSNDGSYTLIPKISGMSFLVDLGLLDDEKAGNFFSSPEHWRHSEWSIPEQSESKAFTEKTDVMCVGFVFGFMLSCGEVAKLCHGSFLRAVSFYFEKYEPEVLRFLGLLASKDPQKRPSIKQVKIDPFLWPPLKKLEFVEDTFVWMKKQTNEDKQALEALNKDGLLFSEGDVKTWYNQLGDKSYQQDALKGTEKQAYDFEKVMELLRFSRNKKHHPFEVAMTRESVARHIFKCFPYLLTTLYEFVHKTYPDEGHFAKYYQESYSDGGNFSMNNNGEGCSFELWSKKRRNRVEA